MSEDRKFGSICRVCLNHDSEQDISKGLSLFEMYNDCIISDQINSISNVEIKEGDGLPDKICPTCLLELQSAYKFKLKCETTNEFLLSAVDDVTTTIENFVAQPMKEEYLEDDNEFDYVDDMTLADLQAGEDDIKPTIEPPKPSRAIDLKLECHDCGGSFKSKCKLRVHWKKAHLMDALKCVNCLSKFKSYAALNSHKKRNLQSCAAATKVHIEGEGKSRVFHCKECNYKSIRIKDMASHMVIHTGERPFHCDICLKTFTQLSSVQSHKESSHKIYKAEGTCQYCGKHFKGKTKLYRHMKHHRNINHPCKICSSVLKSSQSLRNHMKRHSGVKSYACEICPTSFYTSSELYNHKTKVHFKTKSYVCELCSYKTFSHSAMAKHKSKHLMSDFACSVCGTFLDNEQQLSLHMKKHTERHHQCTHCDKNYFSRKNLHSHIRSVHKIVKLNGCGPTTKASSIKSENAT